MKNNTSYTSKAIDDILTSIPEDEAYRIEGRMLLAAKIEDAMNAAGYNKVRFAEAMKKGPSEITKWLSGTHNFTADTLLDIQRVLKISLLNVEPKKVEDVAAYSANARKCVPKFASFGNSFNDYCSFHFSKQSNF